MNSMNVSPSNVCILPQIHWASPDFSDHFHCWGAEKFSYAVLRVESSDSGHALTVLIG